MSCINLVLEPELANLFLQLLTNVLQLLKHSLVHLFTIEVNAFELNLRVGFLDG
jgi:hypothetical protein